MKNPQRLVKESSLEIRMPYKAEKLGVMTGFLFGGARIERQDPTILTIQSSASYENYFNWRCSILESIKMESLGIVELMASNGLLLARKCGFKHKRNAWLYPQVFKNGKRCVNEQVIRHLNPYGLAIWFMEASVEPHGNDSNYYIDTSEFDQKENEKLIKLFKRKWVLHPTLQGSDGDFKLCFGNRSDTARRFKLMISPYVHRSMKHKLR